MVTRFPARKAGEEDLHDLEGEPYKLNNRADGVELPKLKAQLQKRVLDWWSSTGGGVQQSEWWEPRRHRRFCPEGQGASSGDCTVFLALLWFHLRFVSVTALGSVSRDLAGSAFGVPTREELVGKRISPALC